MENWRNSDVIRRSVGPGEISSYRNFHRELRSYGDAMPEWFKQADRIRGMGSSLRDLLAGRRSCSRVSKKIAKRTLRLDVNRGHEPG
jgi:hypothetical protein